MHPRIRNRWRLLSALGAAGAFAASLHGQQPVSPPPGERDAFRFKSGIELINVTATVCFTVPQALAVGEAVERGLARRTAEGKDTSNLVPTCALMIGRLDDWMQVLINRDNITTHPADFSMRIGTFVYPRI